ncbi:MAG: uracil-DNA glycosylase [Acidobacteriales bacterium]|nr:uracil-DNA glycosylase [Terriglobales bacterium]
MKTPAALRILNQEIIACRLCPRLVAHRERIGAEKRKAYREQEYWAKPVPGFGDPNARVLLLGLAPGAHGSNRTGRMFTGDGSGNFLFPVLYKTGFASQPKATDLRDGLTLTDAYITAVARCAPPDNKPDRIEMENCSEFLDRELNNLRRVKVVVALGKIAFDGYLDHLVRRGLLPNRAGRLFAHGAEYIMPDGRVLVASYHPSQQNTLTGRLTETMFAEIFRKARRLAERRDVRS